MEKWLSHIPLRNGTLVIGDMNTPLLPETPICGPGVASERGPAQKDQVDFQALLRRTGCQALNTWRSPGTSSRTFLPPAAGPAQHGTQIDFILVRGGLADHEARQASTISAPFVPTTGCRHLPVQTTLPLPARPRPPASRSTRLIPPSYCPMTPALIQMWMPSCSQDGANKLVGARRDHMSCLHRIVHSS